MHANTGGVDASNLLFVVRVTVVVRSGYEENCKSKKNKEKIPTVDEFLWLIESALETSDRINDNLKRCGMARDDRSAPDGRWLGPRLEYNPNIPLLDGSTFFFLISALAVMLLTIAIFA